MCGRSGRTPIIFRNQVLCRSLRIASTPRKRPSAANKKPRAGRHEADRCRGWGATNETASVRPITRRKTIRFHKIGFSPPTVGKGREHELSNKGQFEEAHWQRRQGSVTAMIIKRKAPACRGQVCWGTRPWSRRHRDGIDSQAEVRLGRRASLFARAFESYPNPRVASLSNEKSSIDLARRTPRYAHFRAAVRAGAREGDESKRYRSGNMPKWAA